MSYESTTPNLGLPQWQAADAFQMEDFNEAFEAIDEATGAKLDKAGGTITGNLNVAGTLSAGGNNVWHAGNLPIADYVVEQGASGSWQYRKWNSGAAECWGNITIETLNMQSVWEGSHYTNPNPASAFPSGLFTEKPKHISVSPNFNGALITWADMYNSTAATLRFGTLRMGTEGESFHDVGFSVYAAGRWK